MLPPPRPPCHRCKAVPPPTATCPSGLSRHTPVVKRLPPRDLLIAGTCSWSVEELRSKELKRPSHGLQGPGVLGPWDKAVHEHDAPICTRGSRSGTALVGHPWPPGLAAHLHASLFLQSALAPGDLPGSHPAHSGDSGMSPTQLLPQRNLAMMGWAHTKKETPLNRAGSRNVRGRDSQPTC